MESEENGIRRNQEDGPEDKWVEDASDLDETVFLHFRTSQFTYVRPEGPNVKIIPLEQLRTGLWVETGIGNGKVCFCNARTKEVIWNRPEGLDVKVITEEQAQNLEEEIQIWKRERDLEKKLLKELQGPAGQRAMEVVEATKVRQVIKNQLKRTGKGFTKYVELIKSTLEMPDQRVRTSSHVPSSSREEAEATMENFKEDFEKYREVIDKIIEVEVVEALEEAIDEAIEERYTCKVCLDEKIEVVFLPCGHLASCSSCASDLRNCPLCHQVIHGTAYILLPRV